MRFLSGIHRRLLRHVAVVLMAMGSVGLLVLVAVQGMSFLAPVATALNEFSVTDIYYQMLRQTGEPPQSKAITIVDMTHLAGRGGRRDIARVIDLIERMGPKVLGIDIVFEGLKEDTVADMALMTAAEQYDNIVFSYKLLKPDGSRYTSELHSFFAPWVPVTEGFTNFQRSLYGGMKRQYSLGRMSQGGLRPSFVLAVASGYAGTQVRACSEEDGDINFSPMNFNELSCDSVALHPELIAGRIVLLGATMEEADMHYTPLGKMSGVELIAYSVQTLLDQKEVRTVSGVALWLLVVLLALVTEWWQDAYERFLDGRRPSLPRLLLQTEVALGLLTFLWMLGLLFVSCWVFRHWQLSINLGWAFSVMALLDACRQFYDSLSEYFNKRI